MDPGEEAKRRRQQRGEERALEEQRKYGLAALAVDTQTGKEINPHLPSILTNVPWYLGTGTTLAHQNKQEQKQTKNVAAPASVSSSSAPLVSTSGTLCAKCGSTNHIARDCLGKIVVAVPSRKRTEALRLDDERESPAAPPPSPVETPLLGHQRDAATAKKAKRRQRAQQQDVDDLLLGLIAAEDDGGDAKKQEDENADKDKNKCGGDVSVPPNSAARHQTAATKLDSGSSSSSSSNKKRATLEDMSTTAKSTSGAQRVQDTASALPKYLISLSDDSAHFDPVSRTMHAAPTPTGAVVSSFEGDKKKAQSKSALETRKEMARAAGV